MDRKKIISAVLIGAVVLAGGCSGSRRIVVGSKNFTEQVLLGEIIAQHLQKRTKTPIERRLNLGGTMLAHQSLIGHEIDLYPEYTGTAFSAILKHTERLDPSTLLERLRSEYATGMQLEWLDPLGFNNSFAMVMRGADARGKRLQTLSEAARSGPWTLGVGYEFVDRADGYAALNAGYQFTWSTAPKTMDLGLLYQALEQNQVSMVAGNTTDGVLSAKDFRILVDDKKVFGPYQACIVVRSDVLAADPELRKALGELSGKINEDQMRRMNYQVDGQHRGPAEVAADFLRGAGL